MRTNSGAWSLCFHSHQPHQQPAAGVGQAEVHSGQNSGTPLAAGELYYTPGSKERLSLCRKGLD